MPDPVRKTVIDGIVSALEASTSINRVTKLLENWWDWDITNFPGCTVIVGRTDIANSAYWSTASTVKDMEANMEVTVRGYCHDLNNSLDTKRGTLTKAIENTMYSSTYITTKTLDVSLKKIEQDDGQIDNFGIIDMTFNVMYQYNHLVP